MPLKPTEIPNPEELKLATMSKLYSPHNFSSLKDEYDSIEFLPSELNEDRLNEILDKISEKGKNSLSIEEIKFLDDYSKLL